MKKLSILIGMLLVILTSCKKQEIESTPLASLIVVNAVSGGGNLVLGNNAVPVYNTYFQAYGIMTGSKEIKLVDTVGGFTKIYYKQSLEFVNGGIYSLFLGGTPESVESVFLKNENIPSHTTDVFGVRVINLSVGSMPISVNLAGDANGSFIPSLTYKAVSTFKDVSSKAQEGDKTFEIKNATSGDLITSFTVPSYDMPRFKNITLILAGNLSNTILFRINNY